MKPIGLSHPVSALVLVALVFAGCGEKNADDRHHHDPAGGKGGHSHESVGPSGASFKAGKGVSLQDETRRILDVETVEVTERQLPQEVRFPVQVFGENHKSSSAESEHAECTGKASGLASQAHAALLLPGQPVRLNSKTGHALGGVVLGINKALALGDAEIVVGITNGGAHLKPGDFLSAAIAFSREKAVLAVPAAALLRTAEGTFVYAANGAAYYRTAVKTGTEAEGFVEISEGLFTGDLVVSKSVEKLWLIELRATKGGGHSH